MDLGEIKARLEAARRVEREVNGATFTLVMPTAHQWRVALQDNRDELGRVLEAKAYRQVLSKALVSWRGLKASDLVPEAPADEVPFTPDARELLLDTRQDIADELTIGVGAWLADQRTKREEQLKNSAGASNGN